MSHHHDDERIVDRRRVVVVGPCASGKSTLAGALRTLGYDANVCGQEHSGVPDLWQRAGPDVLIALHVDLPTVRQRRGSTWSETLYAAQRQRLVPAFAAADLVLDSTALSTETLVARAHQWLIHSSVR